MKWATRPRLNPLIIREELQRIFYSVMSVQDNRLNPLIIREELQQNSYIVGTQYGEVLIP